MSLLAFIDRFSFRQILSAALILAITFAVPTTVFLIIQQTRLYSSAHKSKLPANYELVKEPFGQPSKRPPQIDYLRPFLGKVDDVVFIFGRDFGQNPPSREIYFGGVKAHEEDILRWHDDLIEVMVPEGAVSGLVKVVDNHQEGVSDWPFIVYDETVKTRVFWQVPAGVGQGNRLMVENGWAVARAVAVTSSGQVFQASLKPGTAIMPLVENLPSRDLKSLVLYDQNGLLIPFFVNPLDFGF